MPMRYWWVNQNQTYRHEVEGGYLWSPKRSASGARNPFYESMREVSPGDLIFSFMDTRIQAVGIAESYCWESPKPLEFGTAGQNWENIGWKVLEYLRKALRVAPDYADAMFNLALLLQRKNQYAEAADYWRRYLASDCQSEWATRARRSGARPG
jgi:putative restriction endonuclease